MIIFCQIFSINSPFHEHHIFFGHTDKCAIHVSVPIPTCHRGVSLILLSHGYIACVVDIYVLLSYISFCLQLNCILIVNLGNLESRHIINSLPYNYVIPTFNLDPISPS